MHQITIRNNQDGNEKTLGANRLFICIGGIPNTEWAKAVGIMRDSADYLVTGPDLLAQETGRSVGLSPAIPFTWRRASRAVLPLATFAIIQ